MGPKNSGILTYQDDEIFTYSIRFFDDDQPIAQGVPVKIGPMDQWKKRKFWTIDFTSIYQAGT